MKRLCSAFVVLAACGGSSREAAEPEPQVAVPPAGTIVAGEDAAAARASFARGFVEAVLHHDDAAIEGYTDPHGFCAIVAPPEALEKDPDLLAKCTDEISKNNQLALTMYADYVPPDFQAGEVTSYDIDPKQGIYLLTVLPADGDLEKGVSVMILEVKDRRFVMFAQKKSED